MPGIPDARRVIQRPATQTANRPISASGKPSSETIVAPPSTPFHHFQEFQSEYERSFRPFEKYHYQNGKWVLQRTNKNVQEWLGEVQDARRRALENKERSRGDHFSRDHLLQIPSASTALWEASLNPYSFNSPPVHFETPREPNPTVGETTNLGSNNVTRWRNKPLNTVRHDLVTESNDRQPGASASVAIQTNQSLTVSDLAAKSVSQATQTLPDFSQDGNLFTETENAGKSATLKLILAERKRLLSAGLPVVYNSQTAQPEVDLSESPRPAHDSTRLEILRKAKYFDGKDSLTSLSALPRSASMKSVFGGSIERGSGFHTMPARRPRSSTSEIGNRNSQAFAVKDFRHTAGTKINTDKVPGFFPASCNEQTRPPQHREQNKTAPVKQQSVTSERSNGHMLPVSAFTVSPPPKRHIVNGSSVAAKASDHRKPSASWRLLPPETKKVTQSRRPVSGMSNAPVRSVISVLDAPRTFRSKERSPAWIDL